jgi:hypothetical protein
MGFIVPLSWLGTSLKTMRLKNNPKKKLRCIRDLAKAVA